MGEEIETYILKKLEAAIRESKDSKELNLFAKIYLPKLHKEFTELRDLILKKLAKIKQAQAQAAAGGAKKESTTAPPRPGLAVRDPAANVKIIPDSAAAGAKKDSKVPPPDAGDDKETAKGTAGDNKKETDDDDADDKKETDDAAATATAGDKKETDAISEDDDDDDEKESGAPLADNELDASAETTSGSGKKESNAKSTSQDESQISPALEPLTADDDSSLTPPPAAAHGAKETATFANTTSPGESQISPDAATDHKSKTPPTSAAGGNKEPAVPPAHKSTTTDAKDEDLLREQLYYLNNVLTEWQMITEKPFSFSSDYVSSIKDLSKTIKRIKLDLKPESSTPTASTDNATLITETPQVVEFRWSTQVNLKRVHGFEDKILSLERLLLLRRKDTDTFKAFGIHGMAGVGKTTLCQSIFSRPKVMEYFFPRIWVCLSKQKYEDEDNRKEVVKRMLRCLGIDDNIINKVDEKQSIRGLLFALRLQLTGKRYLIVLDDAHNPDEWFKMPDSDADTDNSKVYEKFSYGLPKECGGTIIVTSRVEQVVKNMVGEEENLRCIEPLTDQETCWKIFKDTVIEDSTLFPPDLEKLKLEIVKRCDGLPLAAKLLGQIKHKELSENPTAAINHPAAVEPGIQQAAVHAAK